MEKKIRALHHDGIVQIRQGSRGAKELHSYYPATMQCQDKKWLNRPGFLLIFRLREIKLSFISS